MSGRNPCPKTGVTAVASRRPPPKAQVQTTIPKKGPPPKSPKKVDYKQPGMTKAMAQRLKHAQDFQKEMERKEREKTEGMTKRRPKRTAAPVGGDARMGRERRPGQPAAKSRPTSKEPPPCPAQEAPPEPGPSGVSRSKSPGGPCPRPARSAGAAKVPAKTRKLASTINADIVQAEPLETGTVDQVIIPPGTLNPEKTTIVSIPQPPQPSPQQQQRMMHESSHMASSTMAPASTSIANKSAQVINESLDEQDAAEAAVVNNKLQDLQQARRDFVLAVANVGGNSINLGDFPEDLANVTPISDITPPMMMVTPESSHPELMGCPDVDSSYLPPHLVPEYSQQHPIVEAAREYLRSRQTERRLEEDFARLAGESLEEDRPEEPQYFDVCRPAASGLPTPIFDDDTDDEYAPYDPFATPPHYAPVPRQQQRYDYGPNAMDELERFVDFRNYPPTPRPPVGREHLNPNLWDYPDVWAKLAPEPSGAPCLMEFSPPHRGASGAPGCLMEFSPQQRSCPRSCPDD